MLRISADQYDGLREDSERRFVERAQSHIQRELRRSVPVALLDAMIARGRRANIVQENNLVKLMLVLLSTRPTDQHGEPEWIERVLTTRGDEDHRLHLLYRECSRRLPPPGMVGA